MKPQRLFHINVNYYSKADKEYAFFKVCSNHIMQLKNENFCGII